MTAPQRFAETNISSTVISNYFSLSLISIPTPLSLSPSVSTCITTCKKIAPPPVPPRTTSKPYISVTVQSSTESAQDNYLDQQDRRSEVNSQSSHAHSNSSDSLDSTRANSLARGIPRPPHIIPTPIAIPRDPIVPSTANASTETSDSVVQIESLKSGLNKGNLVAEEPLVAPVPRRKLSSIGIQVGSGTVLSRAGSVRALTTFDKLTLSQCFWGLGHLHLYRLMNILWCVT